eukprot:CAMPEP_0178947112 /NCGR_PEP_ID=MMETSP0789-20121207/4661_1 /TAXON_ID=3005 /ORGANISM="Rhizosolenia setigera, Strain CCMP 1694" /LENGTH=412 /DNA_ID=CAMNT_0020627181 /DNA_START=191 /DNA_END=1429 /DNA_ORIENTATION=+
MECPEVMCWTSEGDGILVKDQHSVGKVLCPQYFKHSKFQTLNRQFNFYGFSKNSIKISSPQGSTKSAATRSDHLLFKHQFFRRNQVDLLTRIKRSTNNNNNNMMSAVRTALQEEVADLRKEVEGLQKHVESMKAFYDAEYQKAFQHIEQQQQQQRNALALPPLPQVRVTFDPMDVGAIEPPRKKPYRQSSCASCDSEIARTFGVHVVDTKSKEVEQRDVSHTSSSSSEITSSSLKVTLDLGSIERPPVGSNMSRQASTATSSDIDCKMLFEDVLGMFNSEHKTVTKKPSRQSSTASFDVSKVMGPLSLSRQNSSASYSSMDVLKSFLHNNDAVTKAAVLGDFIVETNNKKKEESSGHSSLDDNVSVGSSFSSSSSSSNDLPPLPPLPSNKRNPKILKRLRSSSLSDSGFCEQ